MTTFRMGRAQFFGRRKTWGGPPARPLKLERSLSAWDVIVLTLSALSPAASVYITGASILHMAGTGVVAALPAGGLVAIIATMLYAELGSAFPQAGGIYPGISSVLGSSVGFAALVLALITSPAFLAFVALGFADYVRVIAPNFPRLGLALSVLGVASLCSVLKVRSSAWISGVLLAAEMIAILALVAATGGHFRRDLFSTFWHPQLPDAHGVLVATPLWTMMLATVGGAYACAGSSLAIYFSEDLRGTPSRIGGAVLLVGVIASVTVSTPIVLLAISAPGPAQTLSAEAPIAQFLKASGGPFLAYAITAAVALAILNNAIAGMLAFGRFLYATGRDAIWPKPISRSLGLLHPLLGSPVVATTVLASTAAALCLLGERTLLILLSGEVFTAALVAASVLVGRHRGLTGIDGFRTPLFPLLPMIGFVIIAVFLEADWRDPSAGRPSVIFLASVALIAFGWHALRHRRTTAPPAPRAAGQP